MPAKLNMYKFYRWPNPARGEFSRPFGGIVEVLRQYSRFLPIFGWLEVDKEEDGSYIPSLSIVLTAMGVFFLVCSFVVYWTHKDKSINILFVL